METIPDYLGFLLITGVVLTIAGPVLLTIGRMADRENYIVQKATPLA